MTRKSASTHGTSLEAKLVQVGNYKFTGKVLGKGSFAVVREAIHTQLKVNVSVKTIDLRECNSYTLKHYFREAAILHKLNHPFIMRLFETMKQNNIYFMVSEIIQGGDLCAYVKQNKRKLEENTIRRFSRQIASALRYLHERGIVHRDLKLENVMLDDSKRNVKLIDFGLTNKWLLDSPLKTLCGSPEYSAPELFIPGTMYGPEVDMWAFGVIMFAMAAGRLPFPCLSEIMKIPEKKIQFLKSLHAGLSEDQTQLIKSYSMEFTQLVKGLMNPNCEERLNIIDIYCDPWITNRNHWVDVPHEMLDTHDLQRIIRQLSNKLNITPEKLISELKIRPYGEVGGFFNIMRYEELHRRYQQKVDIKSVTSQNKVSSNSDYSFSKETLSKKRSSKQIYEGPVKISLLGNAMKLNEVTLTNTPVKERVHTPPSIASSGSSGKRNDFTRKQVNITLPKIKTLKSNLSNSISKLKSELVTPNTSKSTQDTSATRRRSISGVEMILPSKVELNTAAKSHCDQKCWLRNKPKLMLKPSRNKLHQYVP